MASATGAGLGKLAPASSALFICDVQERFRHVISNMPAVIDTTHRMTRGAAAFGLPIFVTEQYPKALGNTVAEIILPANTPVVAKTHFSMLVPEIKEQLTKLSAVRQILLVGIEAHVCILQTTLDLLEQGYEVHVVADGVSSQRLGDRAVALQRLASSGAFISTSEMVLFQLLGGAKHPQFKEISALVKEARPDPLPYSSNL
ncbi:hypothetical protein WJX72_010029 [[Myrmecia] bisecta]|uniref:Isochorismatase-like domain-containing protein n=1 Tax=[Myrmecia] bisecta TaxID=41462 RepID=A0AAW1Q539_9CHLO